jgi:hypothetical protein
MNKRQKKKLKKNNSKDLCTFHTICFIDKGKKIKFWVNWYHYNLQEEFMRNPYRMLKFEKKQKKKANE